VDDRAVPRQSSHADGAEAQRDIDEAYTRRFREQRRRPFESKMDSVFQHSDKAPYDDAYCARLEQQAALIAVDLIAQPDERPQWARGTQHRQLM
jgi:hypothetical protein